MFPNWLYTQGVLVTKTTTYAISDEINLVFDTTSFHVMVVFRNTCSPHSFIGKIMACIQLYSSKQLGKLITDCFMIVNKNLLITAILHCTMTELVIQQQQ